MKIGMPRSFLNKTRGLLGVYNNDPKDDFTLPNGTIVSPSSSDEEIFHNFGKMWQIQSGESIFHYENGCTFKDFSNPGFVPLFSIAVDSNATARANKLCGSNKQCVYDLLSTRDESIALASKDSYEQFEKEKIILGNTAPNIATVKILNATVGEFVMITVSTSDADGDTAKVLLDTNIETGYTFDNTSTTLSWIPRDTKPVFIKFVAKDSRGGVSSVHEITIIMCSNCSGHGTCDMEDTYSQPGYYNFYVQSCVCDTGYDGNHCESETDGCASKPCEMYGGNCTDLSAKEQRSLGYAYECGKCPAGYRKSGGTCWDIDECKLAIDTNRPLCGSFGCVNMEGSYRCDCPVGYRNEGPNCTDIDECSELNSGCQHVCHNEIGRFSCSCHQRYKLTPDKKTCALEENANCPLNCQHICDFANSACICPEGYILEANGLSCTDIDECSTPNRNQCAQKHNCHNLDGAYSCDCDPGYKLNQDGRNCDVCDSWHWGYNCSKECDCPARAEMCHKSEGCICQKGWQGTDCNVNVNECNFTDCGANAKCVDTFGSYTCICESGFTPNYVGNCTDIDECKTSTNLCEQKHNCINTQGTYRCFCDPGYTRNINGQTCDECENNNWGFNCSNKCKCSTHAEKCNKTTGWCICDKGWQGTNCEENTNECKSKKCGENAKCVDSIGSYTCVCYHGFTMDDSGSCIATNTKQRVTMEPDTTQPVTTNAASKQHLTTDIDSDGKQRVPTVATAKQPLTTESNAKLRVPTAATAKQLLTTESDAKQSVSTAVTAKQPLTTESDAKLRVPTAATAKQPVTTESGAKLRVPTAATAKQSVTTESDAKLRVPTTATAKQPMTTESDAKLRVPTAATAKQPLTTESDANQNVPTAATAKQPLTTESGAKLRVPTAATAKQPMTTESDAKLQVPTATSVKQHVATKYEAKQPFSTVGTATQHMTTDLDSKERVHTATTAKQLVATDSDIKQDVLTATTAKQLMATDAFGTQSALTATTAKQPLTTYFDAKQPVSTAVTATQSVAMTTNLGAKQRFPTAPTVKQPVTTKSGAQQGVHTAKTTRPPVPTVSDAKQHGSTDATAKSPMTTDSDDKRLITAATVEPPTTTDSNVIKRLVTAITSKPTTTTDSEEADKFAFSSSVLLYVTIGIGAIIVIAILIIITLKPRCQRNNTG